MNSPPPPPPAFGFARRVAALFAVVSTALAVLAIVVTRHVDSMHRSLERLAEEQRETDSAMYLLHHTRMLDVHARKMSVAQWQARSSELEELRFHTEQAATTLAGLRSGPTGEDPSTAEHAADEERLYTGLERGLGALRTELADGASAEQVLPPIAQLLRLAEVLNDEVHAEEARASSELSDEATEVRSAVFWAAVVALAVLLAVLALVRSSVVVPLLELRAGAARIAAGELEHRVAVRTRDEVGELAQEFNRMAGELAGMHAELERRVEERTREFVRAARLAGLGTMAAGIAHEINNPLASIASCAEGLERRLRSGQAEAQEQLEYLGIIAKEAYRAHEITSRLLEFARSDPGPSVDFRPSEVLRDIDVLLRHRLRERDLELVVDCPADLPLVRGRPTECKQIVLNLIHNAIDASPQGGHVDVRCAMREGKLELEVEDQGPGLPPEVAERVFDPFFTTKPPGKGTGLGLSIVERIVAAHGGRVEALDTGHGALFRVTLPIELETAP
jgi:two-component system NtrC family sensor kinase